MVIVQVNFRLYVTGFFQWIQKQFRKLDTKIHVMAASAPLPTIRCFQSANECKQKWMSFIDIFKRILTKKHVPRHFSGCIAGRRVNDAVIDCLKKMLFVQIQIFAQRFGETFSINIWVTSAWN